MACNCKQRNAVIEEYGSPEDENLFEKLYGWFFRVIFFLIAVALAIVIVPIVIIVVIYKFAFVKDYDGRIDLPKMLAKHIN
jgi:hypothetical protein